VLIFGRVASAVLGGAAALITAAVLGPGRTGTYALVVTVATLASSLGHLSVDRSEMVQWKDETIRLKLAANAPVLGVANGVLAAICGFVVVSLLGRSVVPVPEGLLWMALAGVPCIGAGRYIQSILFLREQSTLVSASLIISNGLAAGATLGLALTGHLDLRSAILIWLADQILLFATLLAFGNMIVGTRSLGVAIRSVSIGLRYHLGSLSMTSLLTIDIAILGAMLPTKDVGRYAIAAYLASIPWLATDSVVQVALPRLVGTENGAARATVRILALTSALVVALCVLGGAITPFVIPRILGAGYAPAVAPLEWLLPGTVALAFSDPLRTNLLRKDKPWKLSALLVTGAALNIVLNILLVPPLQTVGAAVASSIAYSFVAVGAGVWFFSGYRRRPKGLSATLAGTEC
jgi:O-antigen/teichoic acid export membrane protein